MTVFVQKHPNDARADAGQLNTSNFEALKPFVAELVVLSNSARYQMKEGNLLMEASQSHQHGGQDQRFPRRSRLVPVPQVNSAAGINFFSNFS